MMRILQAVMKFSIKYVLITLVIILSLTCNQKLETKTDSKVYYSSIQYKYPDVKPLENESNELLLIRKVKLQGELKNKDLYIFNEKDSLIKKYVLFNYYNGTPIFSIDFDSASFVSGLDGIPVIIGYDSIQSDSVNIYFDVPKMKDVWTNLNLSLIIDGDNKRLFREEMIFMPLKFGYKKHISDSIFYLKTNLTGRGINKVDTICFSVDKLINKSLKDSKGVCNVHILKGRRDRGYKIIK